MLLIIIVQHCQVLVGQTTTLCMIKSIVGSVILQVSHGDEILTQLLKRCMTLCMRLGLNGFRDGDHLSDTSRNHTLKGVFQLGEVQAGLRLTVPAAQHQLVPVSLQPEEYII